MKKFILIGLKDVKLAFRDRTALILMLLTPFLLTLAFGFVTGRFSGGTTNGISRILVVIVNQDAQQVGNALVDVFQSKDLAKLVNPTLMTDASAAHKNVDQNQAVAAIVIPAGFTTSIISPQDPTGAGTPVQIQLYTNPTTPTSASVIKTILDDFLNQVKVGQVGATVAVTQLIASGRIQAQQAQAVGLALGMDEANTASQNSSITLKNVTSNNKPLEYDILGLLAPDMALMFLMYTASYGGRSLLEEQAQGTLSRLLVSPSNTIQVLGGKIFGTFLTGLAQIFILILTTTLLFHLKWGDPLGLCILVVAAVFAAVSWGMLIASIAKTPLQVNRMGMALMLVFGLLGGSFFDMSNTPVWLQALSKITPNAWGVDGFTSLAIGGTLINFYIPVLVLFGMGLLLSVVAGLMFHRRGIAEP